VVVLVACLAACDDDDLVTDASVEVMPERPTDAVIDLPAENAPDLRGGGDCPYPACDNEVLFVVPGFFGRFGIEAYDVEVTACRADFCAAARVQTHSNSRTTVTNRDAAVDAGRVSAPGYSPDLRVQLLLTGTLMVHAPSDEVRFRVVTTSSGRLLIDHRIRLPVQLHCPGGRHCGVCEQITVEIDGADGGRPIDAHSPPSPDICQ